MAQGKITEVLMDAIMQEMVGSYEVSDGTLGQLSALAPESVTGIAASNEGIGSLSQLKSVHILPSLRSSSGRDVERSGSSNRRKSRSPRSKRSRSPRIKRSRSPRIRISRSPRISPRIRRSRSPRIRRSRSPPIRRSRSPRIRRSGSPRSRRSHSPRRRASRSPRSRSPHRKTERDRIHGHSRSEHTHRRGESSSSKGRSERGGAFSAKDSTATDTVESGVNQYPATVEEEESHLKAIMTETDALAKLGVHLIRWAGFHSVAANEFVKNTLPHCQLKTEACAKMMTSFKCSLKPEHRTHCLNYVRNLRHPALSPPCLDTDFLNLMIEKGAVESTAAFCEVINPLDNHLQNLQNNLLKCAHPMFLACNEYELNLKPGSDTRAQLFTALEKTISLCRKTLVLLGLSYSSTSAFRREKIMEAVDLKEAAPKPSNFPNLEDSQLFGKEYMSKLRKWLNKTKHPVQVTYNFLTPEQKQQQLMQVKPRKRRGKNIVDPLAIQMIDYLLEYNVKNCSMKGNDTEKPQFWFLFDETSEEYKYYRLKMCEMQKLKRATMDAKIEANAYQRTPEDLANESVRAMIMAKKIKAVKKRFRKDLPFQKKKKRIIKRTIGTQSEFKAPLVPEQPATVKESSVGPEPVEAVSSGPSAVPDAPNAPQTFGVDEVTNPPISNTSVASEPSINLQYSGVDASTKETAENLARFLVEMGHKLAGFNLKILHNKPKFWFLKEKDSPAFKFYYMKFTELCQARGLSYDPHKLDRIEDINPEDSQSRISKSVASNPSGGKISEPLLTDSGCEIIEPEEPNSQATFSLVTYCSESDSSDTEDPAHRSTAEDLEPETPLLQNQTFLTKAETHLSADRKSPNLLCQDRKPNPLVPKGQNPLAEDLICQDAAAQNWKTRKSGIHNSAGGVPVMTVIENPSGLHDRGEKGTTPIDPQLKGSEAGSWGPKEVHTLDFEEMEIEEPGANDTPSGNDGLDGTATKCPWSDKK